MANFKNKLFLDYPIPLQVSIWGGDGVTTQPLYNLDDLLQSALDDIKSDIPILESKSNCGSITLLPDDTICVNSVLLQSGFQGNRNVKFTFDLSTKAVYLRYYPSTIFYRRKLRFSDLNTLEGDNLRYAEAYVLWKMATKEVQVLKVTSFEIENGSVSFDNLQTFADEQKRIFEELKPEILIYATAP